MLAYTHDIVTLLVPFVVSILDVDMGMFCMFCCKSIRSTMVSNPFWIHRDPSVMLDVIEIGEIF